MTHLLNTSLLGLGAALVLGACSAPDASAPEAPAAAPAEMEAAPAAAPASEATAETAAPTLSRSVTVNADAHTVWALIGPFCSLPDWHPVVGSCTIGDDGTRTIVTADGSATFNERETTRDDDAHTYSYAIISSPLPVIDYVATISVDETTTGVSTVTWSSHYTTPEGMDDAAAAALAGIYEAGFAGISAKLAE
ncbi:SRPBCC family protein [uncultured Maricaulis sp.]|uniref:SRPBCC family protein n=1 Tax=uncultured Maricaulis sp. TaxID=174710 RepID=UPI0030DAB8CC|tara:strand:- start:60516 stop:61097 length:582 start_codon:yes stop_codon:yes gene_type:complete